MFVFLGRWDGRARRTYVPALGKDDAQHEEDEEAAEANPSVEFEGGGFVEVALVYLEIERFSASPV